VHLQLCDLPALHARDFIAAGDLRVLALPDAVIGYRQAE
jgi:hypothetical protein